jgi:hypothetical protein
MIRLEKKMPKLAPVCQRGSAPSPSASPRQVVAMPVGPTGGESPQARASRGWPPSQAAMQTKHEERRRSRRVIESAIA